MQTISPVDGRVYVERAAATPAEIDAALQRARAAQAAWRAVPLAERAAILERFCSEFERARRRHRPGAHLADGAPDPLRARARCAARSSARAT